MNDERPIEKLLRRVAKKRRDEAGAPTELHPANRRLLQAEVARQFPKTQKQESWWAGLSLLLNRKLAYAVALVAVIGVAALLILPASNKEIPLGLMALDSKNSPAPDTQRVPMTTVTTGLTQELKDQEKKLAKEVEAATSDSLGTRDEPSLPKEKREMDTGTLGAPASAASPVVSVAPAASRSASNVEGDRTEARRQQVAESVASFNQKYSEETARKTDSSLNLSSASTQTRPAQPTLAASADAAKNSPEPEVFSRRYGLATTAAAAPATGAAKPAIVTNGAAAPGAPVTGKLNDDLNATQAFSQVVVDGYAASGLKPAGASPVLMNFIVEQNGQQIRVMDGDGSTYSGSLQLAVDEDANRKDFIARGGGLEKSRQSRTSHDSAVSSNLGGNSTAQNLFFRVSGTNRTLNQNVNFAGIFVMLTNQFPSANARFQFADKAKAANQQQIPPLLQNSGIRGRLQIGTGREVEINAVPVQK